MEISCEFYPPKTEQGLTKLLKSAQQLNEHHPSYFSVTYGAGGSTQTTTVDTVRELTTHKYPVVPHISCIGTSQATVTQLLNLYQRQGISELVCLRGDMPSGVAFSRDDFHYAADLVQFIRQTHGQHFHIRVAAYPEAHPQATSIDTDLHYFKQKVEAGANSAITQYFYDANGYYQLLEDCAKLNINIDITPGIMPIYNYQQLKRFSNMCGSHIPRWMEKRLESYGDDVQSVEQFGIEVVTRLCEQLMAYQAPGLHFYTLNKAKHTCTILQQLAL